MSYWTTLNLVDLRFTNSARKAANADTAAWRKRHSANLRVFWRCPGALPCEARNHFRMTRCPVVFTNAKSESHPR